jgi:hypothetical protein
MIEGRELSTIELFDALMASQMWKSDGVVSGAVGEVAS